MMRKVYQSILKCDCDNSFVIEEGRIHCTRCDKKYHASKSYINFFEDETKRPYWSMHMQNAFKEHGIVLNMGEKYDGFERFYLKNEAAQDFLVQFEVLVRSSST